jgi:LysM repeat protein
MNKLVLFLCIVMIHFSQAQNDIVKAGEDIIYHQVKEGETIAMLYKKFLVPPEKIYEINEGALGGITSGMMLKIPISDEYRKKYLSNDNSVVATQINTQENNSTNQEAVASSTDSINKEGKIEISDDENLPYIKYEIKQSETLYGIAKKNNSTVKAIKEYNPGLTDVNIEVNQIIFIPKSNKNSKTENIKSTNNVDSNFKENSSNATSGYTEHIVIKGDTLYSLSKKHNTTIEQIYKNNPDVAKKGLQIGQKIKL